MKLCRIAGNIYLFKIMGMLTPENVKLKRNIIWDIIELDWKEVNLTLSGNRINLPKSVTIKFRDKFKIRCIVKRKLCARAQSISQCVDAGQLNIPPQQ